VPLSRGTLTHDSPVTRDLADRRRIRGSPRRDRDPELADAGTAFPVGDAGLHSARNGKTGSYREERWPSQGAERPEPDDLRAAAHEAGTAISRTKSAGRMGIIELGMIQPRGVIGPRSERGASLRVR
jgi:hypothetical protein